MVARTVVTIACDLCAAVGTDSPGETMTIAGAVELDACSEHRSELDMLVEVLTKFGRPAGGVAPKRQRRAASSQQDGEAPRFSCGLCGPEADSVATGTRAYHARRWHDLKGSEIEWVPVASTK
jgi:hypothetical protein